MTDDLAPDDPAWSAIYSREIPEYHAYMRALFNDLVWWKGRQLTTGAELCTCTVTAYDTGTMFSYRRVDDPGCRYHHTGPIPAPAPFPRYGTAPACMCLYGVRRVEGAPGPYAIVNMTARYKRHEWGVWAFKIHPRCPHHGDDVRVIAKARLLSATVDGRPAWETLDDQERRGE